MPFTQRPGRWRTALAVSLTLLAAVLTACGSGDDDNGGGSSNKDLTLVAGVKGDEFYITMNCGAQAEAKAEGASLNFQGPNEFSADQQTPIVDAVAAKKPDAVLIAPTD